MRNREQYLHPSRGRSPNWQNKGLCDQNLFPGKLTKILRVQKNTDRVAEAADQSSTFVWQKIIVLNEKDVQIFLFASLCRLRK